MSEGVMSALGQKQTCAAHTPMSAKCQKRASKAASPLKKPELSPEDFLAKYQIDQAACFRFLRRSGNCHTLVALTILIVPVSVPP
jgi:hypothetical protein